MNSTPALVSSPTAAAPPPPPPPRPRSLFSVASCVSYSSGKALGPRLPLQPERQPSRPLLVTAQSPPPLAVGGVRRDADTGLCYLLLVLTVVMSSFLSLAILSISTWGAFKQLEIAANKLSKVVAEEVPGTLSSLKLSCLEINDFTSQLKSIRQKLTINGFGKKSTSEDRSQTGRQNVGDI